MLLEISIKNFAIIEEISLNFENGMTVLTGETGAGKSIIIDAMNMLLGARASTEMIRHGADKAEIEGFFSVDSNPNLAAVLAESGISMEEELILRRDIFANGRSVSRINGQMVTVSTLKKLGQFLVDIHGQHDQEELMRPQLHQHILDSFGDEAFDQLKQSYQQIFDRYKALRRQALEKQKNEKEHQARLDLLGFQIGEIDAADLVRGEDDLLNQERQRLLNHKKIADTLTSAYLSLDNEDFSSLSQIRSSMNELLSIEDLAPEYQLISAGVSEAYYILEEVTKQLSDTIDQLDFDAGRLQDIELRLDSINSLTRKYGGGVNDVLDYYANITKEYQLLSGGDRSSDELERELKALEKQLVLTASQLSDQRHALALELEADIKAELRELYMEKADFKVQFTRSKFNREGHESLEFYISTNPGEGFKPLVKVASGGELSRLMLAIKAAISKKEDKTSIVFDEVDTGVSGRVAQAIAKKIYKIGRYGQVLAISHLPQVIAIADNQYFISKESKEESTMSKAKLLTQEERIEEIAKMIAGADVTETARNQARELLGKD
ncbi:DNA repair protein RecN [Streptococcus equi subsp. zooepidemicus]|uniref:DNA repair protein RecN n=1 Tax=Streptococcus equi TaxID=1336 RepID=UPI001E4C1B3F|nr:DNA repair protein RecN [Streptococcus equi]MCD3370634.1 DNA repair protein RecN [Streptococcus equi subsp. zooepidemicus]MCD3381506.1 DNA repair protein RecN [Streptococcus equi subsp. zooepidemicus]HEL0564331.1 DNA repair protein RecN [Streptococcus equi subsp. zooepidemicus]HEL1247711.1 DNA repair protein RecN [Streptococcus equi subsp. zooepidemicus]HEL1283168.1 DNA repair protein RecN [Streptococcus equi subsp. zooepidemicus]